MAYKLSNGPQSRAPLRWGEGAKNTTASRHLECPTLMPEDTHSRCPKIYNIGTWNVRTMGPRGKIENVKREMRRANIKILGMSEVRWKGVGDFVSDEFRIIHAGEEKGQRGVAVILDQTFSDRVTKNYTA